MNCHVFNMLMQLLRKELPHQSAPLQNNSWIYYLSTPTLEIWFLIAYTFDLGSENDIDQHGWLVASICLYLKVRRCSFTTLLSRTARRSHCMVWLDIFVLVQCCKSKLCTNETACTNTRTLHVAIAASNVRMVEMLSCGRVQDRQPSLEIAKNQPWIRNIEKFPRGTDSPTWPPARISPCFLLLKTDSLSLVSRDSQQISK